MQVRLQGVTKQFDGHQVIAPTDLTLESGKFTTLLGPSGCGKTTLLRMIAGLEKPDTGAIYFDETPVFDADKGINLLPEKRGLGFVFQDFALWPHMTVFENVAFGLRARKDTKNLDSRVHEALETVRLVEYAKRYPHQLSGGQQQRVAFARAIVIKPSIILFDEPLSALDALLREQMRFEISALARQLGLTSIFVTHDQVEAMSMSDQVVVMDKGDILQKDSPENIYNHPATPFVARFIGKSNWLDENTMVRPEYVRLEPFAGAMERAARVLGVQFLGNSYEILLQSGDMQWHLPSSRAYAVGEEMKVYIDPLKILTYQQKEETT